MPPTARSPRLKREWSPPAEFCNVSPKWVGARAHGKTTQFDLLYKVPPKNEGKSKGINMKRPAGSSAAGNASKKQKQLSLDHFRAK